MTHREGRYPVFVTGGVRSGKSRFAERLAEAAAEETGRPVAYLATAEAIDAEMRARIAAHQARRPPAWVTIEEPLAVDRVLATWPDHVVLVDCLAVLVNNWLYYEIPSLDAAADALVDAVRTHPAPLILVSNEVGAGILPDNPLARRYVDVLGVLNQRVAAVAARVYWLVAGRAVQVEASWP